MNFQQVWRAKIFQFSLPVRAAWFSLRTTETVTCQRHTSFALLWFILPQHLGFFRKQMFFFWEKVLDCNVEHKEKQTRCQNPFRFFTALSRKSFVSSSRTTKYLTYALVRDTFNASNICFFKWDIFKFVKKSRHNARPYRERGCKFCKACEFPADFNLSWVFPSCEEWILEKFAIVWCVQNRLLQKEC